MLPALALALLAATPDDCRETYAAVRYREAAATCLEAIPQTPPEQLAGIYRLAALSLAALGDEARAYAAFASLLALDPRVELSPAISPKLRAVFDRARQDGAGSPIALKASLVGALRADQPVRLAVAVADGPAHPVARVFASADGKDVDAPRGAQASQLELPAPRRAGTLVVDLRARDGFGGAVASSQLHLDIPPLHEPRSPALSWKLWGGAAGVLALGAGGAAVFSQVKLGAAQKDVYADVAGTDLRSARNGAYAADVGFAAAGAIALGAVLLLLTEAPRE